MRVVVTGAQGFLGRHLRLRLRALRPEDDVEPVTRSTSPQAWAQALRGADVVVHCAGVNRGEPSEVEAGNVRLAADLVRALRDAASRPAVVFADSVQAGNGSPYGTGKAAAAEVLQQWGREVGRPVADVLLPNLYGEHGRPGYNSFVATFAHRIAAGEQPEVLQDRQVPLLHVQDAAQRLLDCWLGGVDGPTPAPVTRTAGVVQVRDLLAGFASSYCPDGTIPVLRDRFDVTMFNTLRAALFPQHYPFRPQPHSDARGTLVESVRARGGQGQSFVSTTLPGQRRGDHFHLDKIERFQVVRGSGLIRLRRMLSDDYVEFPVDGRQPAVVDMPTGWAHSIENTGDEELITMFWAHELFDPDRPDTYREVVRSPLSVVGASA